MRFWLRMIIVTIFALGLVLAAACGPATAPATTSAPAKTAAPATKQAQSSPASKTTAEPTAIAPVSATKPAAKATSAPINANWQHEWDASVAAAKKEGKLVVAGAPGDSYRNAVMAFHDAYPDIQVEFSGFSGGNFGTKVGPERDAGRYLWDVYISGWDSPLPLAAKGILDPVKPVLLLPEVLDESKWLLGFDNCWVDKDHKYVFQFMGRLAYAAFINRDVIPESELATIDQLVDPKWQGKISSQDPRINGSTPTMLGYLMALKGEDWLRKLMAQNFVILESRSQAEAVVRGNYPIAMGVGTVDLQSLKREGVGANVKPLDPMSAGGRRLTSGFGNLSLLNKPPNPNAAKVFINWLLSREGQTAYVKATDVNSRRLDVEGPADFAADPKASYDIREVDDSPLKVNTEKAMAISKELIK